METNENKNEDEIVYERKTPFFRWRGAEFFGVNKVLVASWVIALLTFSYLFYIDPLNQQALPGMTEAREHIINFREPVIVDKILIQSGQAIQKGNILFELSRPDIELQSNENAATLREVVVELNILYQQSRSSDSWKSFLENKKKNKQDLTPLEMQFLSQYNFRSYLQQERNRLKVISPVDGYAGEVNFNVGETVAPYAVLISLYQTQPSVVRSYIPESFSLMNLTQNRVSVIRSMSRDHQVAGKIISVGSILTELPLRFQKDPTHKLYGREIKIALPDNNGFYLGEKVYVSLEGS